jgi:hypothetical protein
MCSEKMLCTFFITTALSGPRKKQEGLELKGPHYLVVYADNVNLLGKNKNTM